MESKSGGKVTLVEDGTHFKGSLSSNCPIEVKGRIEGDVTAPTLTVSPTGSVHGKVRVGEIRSEGELAGEFDADVVQLSGAVKDNTVIRAKSLEVKLTPQKGKMQVIFGECELEIGDAPTKEASIAPPATRANKASTEPKAIESIPAAAPDKPLSIPPPSAKSASIPPPNGAS